MNVDLTKHFEGLRLGAYKKDDGVWTVGYGHTGKDVTSTTVWTIDQCEQHLAMDLNEAQTLLGIYSPGPFAAGAEDALIDFVFNLGAGNYRSSTLCKYVNARRWADVKTELLKWDHERGVVVPGLLARRQAEADFIII